MPEPRITTIGKIRPLTTMRFVPALGVVWYHVELVSTNAFTTNTSGSLTHRLSLEGRWGVAFFFVLSGFILAYLYYESMRAISTRNVLSFYLNRFARIFPVHWLTMIVALSLSIAYFSTFGSGLTNFAIPGGPGADTALATNRFVEAVSTATLTQTVAPYGFEAYALNSSSWSLSAELFFYALFPFLMFGFLRLLRWRGVHVIIFALAIMAFQMLRISTVADALLIVEQLYRYPPFRLVEFVLGMGVGMLFYERPIRVSTSRASVAAWTYLEILVLAATLASLVLAVEWVPYELRQAGWYAPAIAVMVYVFAHEGGLISRFMSYPLFVLLGELSFAIYMWHFMIVIALHAMFGFDSFTLWAVTVVIVLMLSYPTYRWLEMPARRGIRRRGEPWIQRRLEEPLVPLTRDEAP